MTINFSKYQGTGNDFIILDNRTGQFNNLTMEQVKKMCHRRFGIGADGLMLLNIAEGYDFEMKYYNADGNEGSMCGNGGRCLVQFAHDIGILKTKYAFIASDGPHLAKFDENNWVHLKMKDVNDIQQYNEDCFLDTGSPHYIKKVENAEAENVFISGKTIRYSPDFAEKGINVNFVQETETGIKVRTYERGVEDETLSCGTGVTASALAVPTHKSGFNKVLVSTPGGDLAVEFYKTGKNSFENIWLCGPATFVFKGEITI